MTRQRKGERLEVKQPPPRERERETFTQQFYHTETRLFSPLRGQGHQATVRNPAERSRERQHRGGEVMAISYREPSLIPPDPPEPDDPITEHSEHLIRRMFKVGHIEWERKAHDLDGYEQDVLEEAYDMGVKAARQQVENIRQNAYGRGVMDAARTAYGGKR